MKELPLSQDELTIDLVTFDLEINKKYLNEVGTFDNVVTSTENEFPMRLTTSSDRTSLRITCDLAKVSIAVIFHEKWSNLFS